jgi:hypothetical protein
MIFSLNKFVHQLIGGKVNRIKTLRLRNKIFEEHFTVYWPLQNRRKRTKEGQDYAKEPEVIQQFFKIGEAGERTNNEQESSKQERHMEIFSFGHL